MHERFNILTLCDVTTVTRGFRVTVATSQRVNRLQEYTGKVAAYRLRAQLPVWWSQIRPVQDSTESGTATIAVPHLASSLVTFLIPNILHVIFAF